MKLKMSLAAAVLSAAASVASAGSGTFTLTNGVGSFASTVAVGSFVDTWSFTLSSAAGNTFGTAVSFQSPLQNNTGDIDFSSVTLSGGSLASPVAFTPVLSGGGGVPEFFTLTLPGTISAGTYAITLSGSNLGPGIASYNGSVTVTAVPEPESYALAMAAIGLLAAGSRIKRHS